MSQPLPEANIKPLGDPKPEASAKRQQSECETTSPDRNINIEPEAKRQRLDNGTTAATQQLLDIVDIDPEGDLLIAFKSLNFAYRIDSNALKRTSPFLYQKCLDVRPAHSSTWTLNGLHGDVKEAAGIILNIIHGNTDRVGESMPFVLVHNIVFFTRKCGMKDRFLRLMTQWFHKMKPSSDPSTWKRRECGRLFIANELGLDSEFKDLQKWAIFNLKPDGKGGIGDPSVSRRSGKPLELSDLSLSDSVVTNRIIRLRLEAIGLVMTKLKEVQLAMSPTGKFGKDGRIHLLFGGHACSKCLDLWFGCLGRSLLRPQTLNFSQWRDFPSISSLIDAKEYPQTLQELCEFTDAIQHKMNGSRACFRPEAEGCVPPQMMIREAVQGLINDRLATSAATA